MDLYEKYGLKDLDDGVLTWDELAATAEVVKQDNIIPIGLSWFRPIFLGSYAQLGGTLSEQILLLIMNLLFRLWNNIAVWCRMEILRRTETILGKHF